MFKRRLQFILAIVLFAFSAACIAGERSKILVKSTIDGTMQPSYLILPDDYSPKEPAPLLVALHSWSRDFEYRATELEKAANDHGWIFLFPNFRGANDYPDACGSLKAQQDILDAVAWVKSKHAVNGKRIYLTGNSGGGHMTMLMAGAHPEVWAAASAWVGISDLKAWHELHEGDKYGKMIRAACGGKPGQSEAIDEQYRLRSPITHIHRAAKIPLDIAAGIHDGHTGSVPVSHALLAFNKIASATGDENITEAEIEQLLRKNGRLNKPKPSDEVIDASFGRAIYLRRYAGNSRVTIFEGGHEGIVSAAIAWLKKHSKE